MADDKQQYIYTFDPVRPEFRTNPDSHTPEERAIAGRHFAYLEAATERGQLILAGRSLDGKGPAVVIIEAESPEAAKTFMDSDPFVAEGIMRASLHPFRASLVRAEKQAAR